AAARDRGGVAARAAAAAARRAHDRPRPGRHARHARADPQARRRRHHRPALLTPARRGRGALQPRGDPAHGPDGVRGRARRAPPRGGGRLRAADHRRHSGPAGVRGRAGALRRPRCRRRDPVRGRPRRRGLALVRTGRGRGRDHRARAGDGHARGALLPDDRGRRCRSDRRRGGPARGARVSGPGALTVYRWELRKLRSQKRTYLGLGFAMAVPLLFVVATAIRNHGPEDVPVGRYVLQSGLAVPLVLLTFGAYWLFPLITALVAGDIVASEDHNGTLKTILTRSLNRGPIFAGKALTAATYALAALVTMA